jgi:hypothetical protein
MRHLYFEGKLWWCKLEALPHYILRPLRLELPCFHWPWHRPVWIEDPNRAHVVEVDELYGKREPCGRHDLRNSGGSSLSHVAILLDANPPRFLSDG